MKKILSIISCSTFICSCSVNPYIFSQTSAIMDKNGEVCVVSPYESTEITLLKLFFLKKLDESGFKLGKDINKCRFVLALGTDERTFNFTVNMATYGITGINSINTSTTGNFYGNASTSYYNYGSNTNFSGNFSSNSVTNINYEKGITGYIPVTQVVNKKTFAVIMFDKELKHSIFTSTVHVEDDVTDRKFINNVMAIYTDVPFTQSDDEKYSCFDGNCYKIRWFSFNSTELASFASAMDYGLKSSGSY